MEELRNLQEMAIAAANRFEQYDRKDFVLPQLFKEQVKEINSNTIVYNKYSAVIENRGNQCIFMPNQWFYIASYFTDLYNELQRYRDYALSVFSKERLKNLNGLELSESEKAQIDKLLLSDTSKEYLVKFITDYSWWGGAKTIDRNDFFVSPVLAHAQLVNASQSFVAELCAFLADKTDLVNLIISSEENIKNASGNSCQPVSSVNSLNKSPYTPYLAAIRTKPFLLLAGISGTGKSRIVRELARACWNANDLNRTKQVPDNYALIPVKPNWHDSTELIGYVSRIGGTDKFIAGPFIKFIAKAWKKLEMPHFLCLDEMNLAPVEQYFAEYLSVIETRRYNNDTERIETDPIIEKSQEDWYRVLTSELADNDELRNLFLTEGISLPPNLIVMGTVNMDETTFSFSRKVLDRAMTIEMNEVNLSGGLGDDAEVVPDLSGAELIGKRTTAEEVYQNGNTAELETMNAVLEWLEKVNKTLEGTPFKIAYRTRNEVILYVINSMQLGKDMFVAFDEAVNMKILPRIEGDKNKVDKVLENLQSLFETIISDIDAPDEDKNKFNANSPSISKLKEMITRRDKQYYCTYWS